MRKTSSFELLQHYKLRGELFFRLSPAAICFIYKFLVIIQRYTNWHSISECTGTTIISISLLIQRARLYIKL